MLGLPSLIKLVNIGLTEIKYFESQFCGKHAEWLRENHFSSLILPINCIYIAGFFLINE